MKIETSSPPSNLIGHVKFNRACYIGHVKFKLGMCASFHPSWGKEANTNQGIVGQKKDNQNCEEVSSSLELLHCLQVPCPESFRTKCTKWTNLHYGYSGAFSGNASVWKSIKVLCIERVVACGKSFIFHPNIQSQRPQDRIRVKQIRWTFLVLWNFYWPQ